MFTALVAPATATPDWCKGRYRLSEHSRALTTRVPLINSRLRSKWHRFQNNFLQKFFPVHSTQHVINVIFPWFDRFNLFSAGGRLLIDFDERRSQSWPRPSKPEILFYLPSPTTPTPRVFLLSPVSLASRDQDGGLSNSTIDIYHLTEKEGTVNSLYHECIIIVTRNPPLTFMMCFSLIWVNKLLINLIITFMVAFLCTSHLKPLPPPIWPWSGHSLFKQVKASEVFGPRRQQCFPPPLLFHTHKVLHL